MIKTRNYDIFNNNLVQRNNVILWPPLFYGQKRLASWICVFCVVSELEGRAPAYGIAEFQCIKIEGYESHAIEMVGELPQ